MRKRVVIYSNSAWNLYNFRKSLILRLLNEGYEVILLAPEDAFVERLRELGCTYINLSMDNKGTSVLRELGLLLRLRKALRSIYPDIILSYTIKCNIYSALVARKDMSVIPNVTGLGTAFLNDRLLNKLVVILYRSAFRRMKVVFFQNSDDRNLFIEKKVVCNEQAHILPGSGIDLKRFTATAMPKSDTVSFILIARMLWDKGVGEFVEAAKTIHQDYPNTRFLLLGPCGVENRTAIAIETLQDWQADGNIEYLGSTDDVRPYVAAADCVVLPSYREGTPRSLLEAGAMARPIITTDAPGCRDVVETQVTGFLCEIKSVKSLETSMRKFLSLPRSEREAMGQRGHQKIEEEYEQEIVIKRYLEAILEVSK